MASARFASELSDELPKLVKDKVITKQQADSLRKRYGTGEDHGSKLVGIISTFGAILIALGILTLVAMNWDAISRVVRVLILLAATFGFAGAGYWLRFEKGFPRVGSSLLFLGSALVGATLVLIAQMYHLDLSSGAWLLLWLVAIAPLAYAVRSKSSLTLALLVLAVWIAYRVSAFANTTGWDELEGIFQIWPLTVSIFLSFGAALWGAGELHERSKGLSEFAGTYRILGAVFFLANTYFLTYRWFTDGFWTAAEFAAIGIAPIILIWTCAVIGTGIFAVHALRTRERIDLVTLAGIGITLIGAALIVTNPTFRPDTWWYGYEMPLFTPYSLIANIALLALTIGTAALGVIRRSPGLVNIAALVFAVDVISRYFEFFFDRLSGGTFFIVTGVTLILAAVAIERTRRALVRAAEDA